jgi:hypothetical protein
MHSLTSVGCGLAVAGQTQTFKRFLLALGHTYIRCYDSPIVLPDLGVGGLMNDNGYT